MRSTTVFSIELTDQDLADLPDPADMVTIDDVGATDPVSSQAGGPAMNDDYDLVEIELTAEEMDQLLSGSY